MKIGWIVTDENGTEWEVTEAPREIHSNTGDTNRAWTAVDLRRADGSWPEFVDRRAPEGLTVKEE